MIRRRALIVSAARPSSSGTASWRRVAALIEFLRELGYAVDALILAEGDPGLGAARALRRLADLAAFARPADVNRAVAEMDAEAAYEVAVCASPRFGACLGLFNPLAVRFLDVQRRPRDRQAGRGETLGDEAEAALFAHADVAICSAETEMEPATSLGVEAIRAPFLRLAERRRRPVLEGEDVLAGVWVENESGAIDAAAAFFDEVARRGGGAPPHFAVGGPGAAAITPPTLPWPVTVFGDEIDEVVFYRGLDIAIAPDLSTGAPRLDVCSAMEMGATPLASSSALYGMRRNWRLPHFDRLDKLAEYLFENGQGLRDGRLLSDLRARADWTWAGLQTTAARQRARLSSRIRAHRRAKRRETADEPT